MPGGAAKKGAVGVVALLGVIFARSADDCAKLGGRGARAIDDVAGVGARTLGDDAVSLGGRGRGLADDALGGGRGLAGRPAGSDLLAETAEQSVETAVELGAQIVTFDVPSGAEGAALPSQVKCPSREDLTLDAGAWRKFLGGFGIACAPATFISRAKGDALLVDGDYVSVQDMARECAAAGGVCMFVACEGDGRCFGDAKRAALMVPLQRSLQALQRSIAEAVIEQTDASWVAFMAAPGQLAIVRAGDRAAER